MLNYSFCSNTQLPIFCLVLFKSIVIFIILFLIWKLLKPRKNVM